MLTSVAAALGPTLIIGALLFGSAGRLDLPMVWAYLAVFLIIGLLNNFLISRHPGLLERRLRFATASSDVPDWLYRGVLIVGNLSHYVIAGLDVGRYHWSGNVPIVIQIVGLFTFAAGICLGVWAATVNPFFAGEVRIQADRGQHVISSGPYQIVRHPGYTGGALYMLASGVALGSWWSVLPMLPVVATLIRRTALEDRLLRDKLEGYSDYTARVRFRLVPGVW